MHQHTSALDALRSATADLHARLEACMPVAGEGAGRTEYAGYLADMWAWLRPLDPALWAQDWPDAMCAGARAGKVARIAADLRYLGYDDAALRALPVMEALPALDDPAGRYGIAYAIEGAQLGVRVLARRLAPRLDGWSPAWLEGYGERSADHWKTFVGCAERALDTPVRRQAAACAARAAFAALLEHCERRRADAGGKAVAAMEG